MKYTEDEIWKIILELDWKPSSKTNRYHKTVKQKLMNDYIFDIEEIKNFVKGKRKELQQFLREWRKEQKTKIIYHFGSDDSFWDLTAHIVGLGKDFYEYILNNPKTASDMANERDYVENFEYSFNVGGDEDYHKLLEKAQKIEDRKRKLNK
jgi:Protein of unknown function (DUF4240)